MDHQNVVLSDCKFFPPKTGFRYSQVPFKTRFTVFDGTYCTAGPLRIRILPTLSDACSL